ncbi:MAG: hypothetical protein M1815_005325 [Lichina confinis]|nr:MAG: hypothetical protein M1815_005325 [Lichina confinis]
MPDTKATPQAAKDFLEFVNASPTPFHAVESVKKRLDNAGFRELLEVESWPSQVHLGGKYYCTRNGSSIVAFAVGKKWRPGNSLAMVGAHTDSPCLRVKPVSKKQNDGFIQVGVETYGGGLWHTWFDRDLSIAGRAMVRSRDGTVRAPLVKIDRPILRIPTLAIHLDAQDPFSFNKETQLFPIAGLVAAELNRTGQTSKAESTEAQKAESRREPLKSMTQRHHPYLLDLIAQDLRAETDDIVDFEMVLYDTQQSCIGGLNNELIFSARLDNLMMSFCGLLGLVRSVESASSLDDEPGIRLLSLFDHEEIGSLTAQGADSNLLPSVVSRLTAFQPHLFGQEDLSRADLETNTGYEQSLATSVLLSADMAHAVHPNYPTKYESDHRPEINQGVVIKINANARYATNSPGIVLLQEMARRAGPAADAQDKSQSGVPLQLFVVRNDSRCGSTIGPMLSAALGVRTVDIGNPQLSMHSIRETGGVYDVDHAIQLLDSFYRNFSEVKRKIIV